MPVRQPTLEACVPDPGNGYDRSRTFEIPDEAAYRPPSILLQWHITERCNLRCAHCYQESYSRPDPSLEALLGILHQFTDMLQSWNRGCSPGREGDRARRVVPGQITLTGGEPLLHADFFPLLEAISRLRPSIHFSVLTNGSVIDQGTAARLRSLRPAFVQISLEGTEGRHDEIRGPGSYGAALAGIDNLVKAGIRTLISFTAHKANFRDFPEVAKIGQKLGVTRVWADRLIPNGSGSDLDLLTPSETAEFLRIMQETASRGKRAGSGTEIAMHRALQFLAAGGHPYSCQAGNSLITIMPDGELLPCRRMPVRVGNVLEEPLSVLYQKGKLFQKLRDEKRISRGCADCIFAALCRGGLRCLAYAVKGDAFAADPGCPLARHN